MCQRSRICARALVPASSCFAPSCLFFATAASRQFVGISDDNEVTFSKEMENENTAKKTGDDVTRIFREYLDTTQERRDITQIIFPDLQKILMKFFLVVKKKMEGSTNHPQSVGPVTVDLPCLNNHF